MTLFTVRRNKHLSILWVLMLIEMSNREKDRFETFRKISLLCKVHYTRNSGRDHENRPERRGTPSNSTLSSEKQGNSHET
jgi:hypothetical protein